MPDMNGYEYERIDGKSVYLHRTLAGKYRGFKLTPEEVVHHVDERRGNNSESNLMVMRSSSDHSALHAGAEPVFDDNLKHWYCNDIGVTRCDCGGIKSQGSGMCAKCLRNKKALSRNTIDAIVGALLTTATMEAAGRKLGMSSQGMRKQCLYYGLPENCRAWESLKKERGICIQKEKRKTKALKVLDCGTVAKYVRGCRCDPCKKAKAVHRKEHFIYDKEKRRQTYLDKGY